MSPSVNYFTSRKNDFFKHRSVNLCMLLSLYVLCVCVFLATEQFQERAISYQQFSENPSIIDDPNLVVKIGNKYVLLYYIQYQSVIHIQSAETMTAICCLSFLVVFF